MRIGIVSDIHCNVAGLAAAIERMGPVDELICAGDSVFEYRFSNEVVELLRARDAHTIQGNHEMVLLSHHGERARSAAWIKPDCMQWLADLPMHIELERAGKKILIHHGSPLEPYSDYLYPNTLELRRLAEVDADYIVLGHTHHQMAERVGRALVINPGSAGDGRDPRNGRQLSYAVLDVGSGEVRFEDYTV